MSSKYDDLIWNTENRCNPVPGYISNMEDALSVTIVDKDKWEELIKVLKFQSRATDALAKDVQATPDEERVNQIADSIKYQQTLLWEEYATFLGGILTSAAEETNKKLLEREKELSELAGKQREQFTSFMSDLDNKTKKFKRRLIALLFAVPTVINLLFLLLYIWLEHSPK